MWCERLVQLRAVHGRDVADPAPVDEDHDRLWVGWVLRLGLEGAVEQVEGGPSGGWLPGGVVGAAPLEEEVVAPPGTGDLDGASGVELDGGATVGVHGSVIGFGAGPDEARAAGDRAA